MAANNPKYQARYYKTHYSKKRSELLAKLGGKCGKCEKVEGLTCHHINPAEANPVDLANFWGWAAARQSPHLAKLHLLCQTHRPNANPAAGRLTHGTYWACFKKKCKCEACQAYRLEFYVEHNEARRLARRAAGVAERPIGEQAGTRVRKSKRPPVLWKDLQVAAAQLTKSVRPKPAEPAQVSRAPHGSWHQSVNLKCKCERCKRFLKDC